MAGTELWLIDFSMAGIALEAAEATTPRLSDETLQRLAAMSDEMARRQRRLSHIALRILLERHAGPSARRVPFARTAAGKPYLDQSDLPFSLAHTTGFALIAVGGDEALGVDIERPRPVSMSAERRAPIEEAAVMIAAGVPLEGNDDNSRFLRAWVRIEALAKANGNGVGPLLERLRPGKSLSADELMRDAGPWVVHDVAVSADIFAAVAIGAGQPMPALTYLGGSSADLTAIIHDN